MKWFLWTINKHVLFSRVSVHVDKAKDIFVDSDRLVLLFSLIHIFREDQITCKLLDSGHNWMDSKIWPHVPPVQVIPRHAGSVIADYDAISVNHRHNFEDHSFSELLRLMTIPEQILDESLHHV